MSKETDFYEKLRYRLSETTIFPTNYMFKFITPADVDKLKQIENVFNGLGAVIKSKSSKNGNYNSLTIMVNMDNTDEIIEKYEEVDRIEGVISL
ncbi:MAG: DUF493 domain-containing protein [Flavobacteriaceae bacterium]|nr:DUF493 domain-containing protein [Flavobacteriaceae bacterium]